MPKPCSICNHPERKDIDKALLDAEAGHRNLARRFEVSASALFRHRQNHLPQLIARGLAIKPRRHSLRQPTRDPANDPHAREIAQLHQAAQAQKEHQAIDTLQQLKAINAACLEVLRQARDTSKHNILLQAVDRIARQIELQARLLGHIQDASTVNIAVLPEWHNIRHTVLEALRPYPEARLAVVQALQGEA